MSPSDHTLFPPKLAFTSVCSYVFSDDPSQRMDVDSCILQYEKLSQDIFKTGFQLPGKQIWDAWRGNPWFSGDELAKSVQTVVRDNLSPEEKTALKSRDKRLEDAGLFDPGEQACKT